MQSKYFLDNQQLSPLWYVAWFCEDRSAIVTLMAAAAERDLEELLLGSIFYCCQIGGKSRTADSDQMAPFYTRQT